MANNFGRVNVSVTASTGALTAGLSRAGKTLNRFANTVNAVASPVRMLGGVMKSTFGQLALFSMARSAVQTLTGLASSAAENVDILSKMSRRLGTTYGELAGLKLAGDLAGVSIEEIGKAMTKADVAMVKAQQGSTEAKKAFLTLGLATDTLAGMSGAARFEAIATAISKLPTQAQRSAAAVALFGRAGAELLPLFEDGAGSIRQARVEAQRYGLALSDMQGKNVEEMNDSFTRVYESIQGIVQQMTAYLAPAITHIANRFTQFVGSVGGANIGQAIGRGIIEGAKYLAVVADHVINAFRELYFAIADTLGVATKEAKALADMQAKINAGTAPQTAVPGGGGFVTQLAPEFKAEFDRLSQVVAQQRKPLTTFTDLVSKANASLATLYDTVTSDAGRRLSNGETVPRPFIAAGQDRAAMINAEAAAGWKEWRENIQTMLRGGAQRVRVSSQELQAIVAGTMESQAFRNALQRGADPRLETKDEQRRTADATERAANTLDELNRKGGIGVAVIS